MAAKAGVGPRAGSLLVQTLPGKATRQGNEHNLYLWDCVLILAVCVCVCVHLSVEAISQLQVSLLRYCSLIRPDYLPASSGIYLSSLTVPDPVVRCPSPCGDGLGLGVFVCLFHFVFCFVAWLVGWLFS